jgi:hypothetical protein
MTQKSIIAVLLFLFSAKSIAQDVVNSLYGFQLGQYRDAATHELGRPLEQKTHEDGFEYEIFTLHPNNSLYMVFEYAKGHNDLVWSIQIAGTDTMADIGFKGLRLGAGETAVEKALGEPDVKNDLGEFGEQWEYDNANYSVEMSTDKKLSSIKIMDKLADEKPDLNNLPKFKDVAKTFSKGTNAEIAALLSPDMEIYINNETLYFGKSIRNEILTDASKLFETIRKAAAELDKVNNKDIEENMRLALGENPKHVIKITGSPIKEIVFKYKNGEFLVWEIDIN